MHRPRIEPGTRRWQKFALQEGSLRRRGELSRPALGPFTVLRVGTRAPAGAEPVVPVASKMDDFIVKKKKKVKIINGSSDSSSDEVIKKKREIIPKKKRIDEAKTRVSPNFNRSHKTSICALR